MRGTKASSSAGSLRGPPSALATTVGYPSRMSPSAASSRPHATWDDFIALEEDDLRELIDGELVEVEVPTFDHEEAVAVLLYFLRAWIEAGSGGRVVGSGYKVRVSDRRGVMPDLQFYRGGNDAPVAQRQGLAAGRPDLVAEVVSPSSRRYDRVTKLLWYAELGVAEYWIVDPEARTLERLVLRDGAYVIAASLEGDDVFRPESFAGLAIPLRKLWGAH
jgi:Uma2 family endonuclease